MYVEKAGIEHKLDMHLKKGKAKTAALDGVPVRKSSELYGMVHIISFSPEDLSIVKEGPAERRRMVDMELCQLDRIYLHQLTQYNKLLDQRNSLLRQLYPDSGLSDTLSVWDEQLADYGKQIIEARKQFIAELNELVAPLHENLSGGRESLSLRYEPNAESEELLSLLRRDLSLIHI